ncbi:hypothetical protein SAMN05192540_0690 [Maribacter dokdonensis]|uniref:Uncharacterized protein n=1 Tax=Maribacter dokdonensis TaxID=320912 RepID=A0A1H4K120_9FLAO|nr:hypothetical protein SAMN05192540_0690 [Maribacter dokdonensis]
MNLETNKRNAIAFYRTAYLGNPKLAIEMYVGKEYIQHNPAVANSTQGFIDYLNACKKNTLKNLLNLYVALQKEIWLHYTRTKYGQEMTNMLQWIFSGLIQMEKYANIGMLYSKYQRNLKIQILCINPST